MADMQGKNCTMTEIFVISRVFPAFAGSQYQYENFVAVAENMRNDYDFLHTLHCFA